ncbi:MAG TPA: cysteine desulfurase [Gammaproteobacteria bacterium]|nr:cysteine desulfurase [Gammaproteobacteria bacterium]
MAVYLDHNATTPLSAVVAEAMMPYMSGIYGNPSSVHRFGRITRDAIEQARTQVAQLVDAEAGQIIFTSGGTEANNLAIKGVLDRLPVCAFAVSAIEHKSVLEPARSLQKSGWKMDVIGVSSKCEVEVDALERCMNKDTKFVSVMAANNETGVVQDVQRLCQAAKATDARRIFHTDACQLAGKLPFGFSGSGVDLMSLSSHKLYGPQGAGALVVKQNIDLSAQLQGGGQERQRRSGTENIAALVGFGAAAELAAEKMQQRKLAAEILQKALIEQLTGLSGIEIFSVAAPRIPNTVQFSVSGIDGETLLMLLDKKGFAVSSGSACDSAQAEPGHVLLAMGVPAETARGAIRVSFGEQNTGDNVSHFVEALNDIRQQFN